jgi:hypothetical protein
MREHFCYGLLKYFENPLMRVREGLLSHIVQYWDAEEEAFIV